MNDRPTPEQIERDILDRAHDQGIEPCVVEALREHGWHIVHPDDVPQRTTPIGKGQLYPNRLEAWRQGWDDCRRHIFGDDR